MINKNDVGNEMSDLKWNLNANEFVSSPNKSNVLSETIEEDTPTLLMQVDKINYEDEVMEESQCDIDFNVWPLNTAGLESITGSVERELDSMPQHGKDAMQKQWKQYASHHKYTEQTINKHIE